MFSIRISSQSGLSAIPLVPPITVELITLQEIQRGWKAIPVTGEGFDTFTFTTEIFGPLMLICCWIVLENFALTGVGEGRRGKGGRKKQRKRGKVVPQ